ncbi:MAG: hypothetical protein NC095_03630 [Muribaculum sp.]|nr:hypothetical protein [Muribaculum sp.]
MLEKLINNKFVVGMASIFKPSVIRVRKINTQTSDYENIYNDWVNVGNYIQSAYNNCTNK